MDMIVRKILRNFIEWQQENDMLKNDMSISYEVAETYLEQKNVSLDDFKETITCPECKGNEIADTETGYLCCYTDCSHEWVDDYNKVKKEYFLSEEVEILKDPSIGINMVP